MNYVYAKIIGSEVSHYPSSISYLITQGMLTNSNPTNEELLAANIVKIIPISTLAPVDGHVYATKPVQQPDGSWSEEWFATTSNDQQQINIQNYRQLMLHERNVRLFNSDWTQLPDVPQATRQAWITYRQALRDVPTQAGFPFSIQWPQAPNR